MDDLLERLRKKQMQYNALPDGSVRSKSLRDLLQGMGDAYMQLPPELSLPLPEGAPSIGPQEYKPNDFMKQYHYGADELKGGIGSDRLSTGGPMMGPSSDDGRIPRGATDDYAPGRRPEPQGAFEPNPGPHFPDEILPRAETLRPGTPPPARVVPSLETINMRGARPVRAGDLPEIRGKSLSPIEYWGSNRGGPLPQARPVGHPTEMIRGTSGRPSETIRAFDAPIYDQPMPDRTGQFSPDRPLVGSQPSSSLASTPPGADRMGFAPEGAFAPAASRQFSAPPGMMMPPQQISPVGPPPPLGTVQPQQIGTLGPQQISPAGPSQTLSPAPPSDSMNAKYVFTDYVGQRPGYGFGTLKNPANIVAHDTSGVAGRLPRMENVNRPGGGYHYIVDPSGEVGRHIPDGSLAGEIGQQAPGAAQYNKNSVQIANIGFEGQPLSPQAQQSTQGLLDYLSSAHKIPSHQWVTHPELGPAGTRSGGKNPMEASWLPEMRGDAMAIAQNPVADRGAFAAANQAPPSIAERGLTYGRTAPTQTPVGPSPQAVATAPITPPAPVPATRPTPALGQPGAFGIAPTAPPGMTMPPPSMPAPAMPAPTVPAPAPPPQIAAAPQPPPDMGSVGGTFGVQTHGLTGRITNPIIDPPSIPSGGMGGFGGGGMGGIGGLLGGLGGIASAIAGQQQAMAQASQQQNEEVDKKAKEANAQALDQYNKEQARVAQWAQQMQQYWQEQQRRRMAGLY